MVDDEEPLATAFRLVLAAAALKHPVQEASARGIAHGFTMTNVLLPEGLAEGSGTLSAILDAREIYPAFPQLGVGADGDKMREYPAPPPPPSRCKKRPATPTPASSTDVPRGEFHRSVGPADPSR